MTADLFGDAPPSPNEPRVLTVSELTRSVRSVLEAEIGVVWVEGEISNYRKQPSGHQYFTLKDAQSQIACVWFARAGLRLKQIALADGMQVQVRGALTVYEARGQYQLNVQAVQAGGAGLLQAKFEALKRKLEAEGLFEAERKRPMPKFPTAIGIVTSSTGAALRDVLNILARRAPWVRVVISPVRVQGDGAAEEIAAAIMELNRFEEFGLPPVDVILVGRGGGSVEDLWEFNEEVVARAIAASAIPVVSAVGHEIDFTIADFAADLRAPTPSAAAELLVPDTGAVLHHLARLRGQLQRVVAGVLGRERSRLDFLTRSALFREPQNRLAEAAQRTDLAIEALNREAQNRLGAARQDLAELSAALRQHRPDQLLAIRRQHFGSIRARFAELFRQNIEGNRERLERLSQMLRVLSPEATLSRGYSITLNESGAIIRSASEVLSGAKIVTRLKDGRLRSTVSEAQPEPDS
jgi:exodeoxyribonuclease VII large subunit